MPDNVNGRTVSMGDRMRKYGLVKTSALPNDPPSKQIVGPSEKRIALLFSPPTGESSYTVSNDPGVTLGSGMNLGPTAGPLLITLELFGDAVQKPWFGIASNPLTIGFLETVCDSE
jgi:hypothetical protein